MIHPHLAEKMGTLLFWGTLGHTVVTIVSSQVQAQVGPHEQVPEEDGQPAGAHEDGRDQRGL